MNRERRWSLWVAVIAGLVLLIVVAGLSVWRLAGRAHYERAKQDSIAAGSKLTIEEQLPVVKPGESNGGDILTAHLGGMPRRPGWLNYTCMEPIAPGRALVSSLVDPLPYEVEGNRWTNNLWDVLPEHVEPSRGAWVLLKQAITNDVIAFDLPYADKVGWSRFGHLADLKAAIAWLQMTILHDLHAGNHADALDELVAGTDLIGLWREPFMVSQMFRGALFRIHVQVIWEALQRRELWSDMGLARMQGVLQRLEFANQWDRATRMERAMGLRHFESSMKQWRGDLAVGTVSMTAGEKLFVALRDEMLGGDWNEIGTAGREFVWAFSLGYFDAARYLSEMDLLLADTCGCIKRRSLASQGYVMPSVSTWFQMTGDGVLGPGWLSRVFELESIRSLALTAVALERYRRLSRRYPESLEALVPDLLSEVPVDWFDGKPLRYRLETPTEFRLWSIGKDGADDAGTPSGPGKDWLQGKDLVWPQAAGPAEVESYLKRQRAKLSPPAQP